MYTETTKELLESIVEIEDIRAKEKKKKKKPLKQRLNYLFTKKSSSDIKDIAENPLMEGFSESEIARAAMYIGLSEIQKAIEKDRKHARGLLHISRLKTMFQ
jgi:hypothetical protein